MHVYDFRHRLILALCGLALGGSPAARADLMVNLSTSADTFTRSLEPDGNYGGAGALSVSGSAAVNGSGVQMGLLESFLRFDAAAAAAQANAELGLGQWTVSSAVLRLTEQAAPNQTNFNRGSGQFEIRWVQDDAWAEGTGNPSAATTDGLAYADRADLLNPGLDQGLGLFTNASANTRQSFALSLDASFTADLLAGQLVTLFLTPANDAVGATFNSRTFGTAAARPSLDLKLTLIPEPSTGLLLAIGLLGLRKARRRFLPHAQ